MSTLCDLLAAEVHVGPAACDKTLGGTRKQVAELAKLGGILGNDHMVDPVFVLDLCLRDEGDPGIVLKERFPSVEPVRLEGIAGSKYLDTLGDTATDQLLRLHEPGNGNRVR